MANSAPARSPGFRREQGDAAKAAPDAQNEGRSGEADRGLKYRRDFGDGGLDQHLLQAPEHAAQQQQGDSPQIKMLAARHARRFSRCHTADPRVGGKRSAQTLEVKR